MRVMEHNGNKVWIVMAQSEVCPNIPENKGIIRVDDYKQSCVLTTDGKVGSKGKAAWSTCTCTLLYLDIHMYMYN